MFRSVCIRGAAAALLLALGLTLLGMRPLHVSAHADQASVTCVSDAPSSAAEEPPDPCLRPGLTIVETLVPQVPLVPVGPVAVFCQAFGTWPPAQVVLSGLVVGELPPDPCAT